MRKNFLHHLKFPFLIVTIIIGIVSCEKDFKNIGDDLLDSNLFSTGKYNALINAYNVAIPFNKSNSLDYNLLGYTENSQFGSLTASVVGQLTLPSKTPDWGNNAVIDSVVFSVPYLSHLDGTQDATNPNDPTKTIKVPNYVLDSVFTGGTNKNFMLKVYELGTYLNTYNPSNPYEYNEFFSNQTYSKVGSPLYSGLLSPNRNDTMMVINRYRYENANLSNRILYKKDTIKVGTSKPMLNLPLNKQKIKEIFQDNATTSHFISNQNFTHFFKGLYFEATNSGNGTALMYLKMGESYMTIYYTESKVTDEASTEDLNGNGIMGELNIIVATPKTFVYNMSGIKASIYDRNYTGSLAQNYLSNPNTIQGDDKLFIHGAAGADAVIRLFGNDTNNNDVPDELETLRLKNWLVNDAKLYLYIDPVNNTGKYPERLYLYRIEDGKKYQTYETIKQGNSSLGGYLVKNADDEPDYYLFRLTDYISEILKSNEDVKICDFGLKTFDPTDLNDPLVVSDTIMRKFNNQFKGVILTGKNTTVTPRDIKLEISYTEKNN